MWSIRLKLLKQRIKYALPPSVRYLFFKRLYFETIPPSNASGVPPIRRFTLRSILAPKVIEKKDIH